MLRRLFHSPSRWLGMALLLVQSAVMAQLTFAASLSISPAQVTMPVLASRTFSVTAQGLPNNQVTWQVNGQTGGNSAVGTIQNGVYSAPDTPGASVTITAVSVADPSVSASAQVTLRHRVPWVLSTNPLWLPIGNYTLYVQGDRFVPGAQAFLAGQPVSTEFVDAKTLRITGQVSAGQIGTQPLVVTNPGPVPSATYMKLAVVNTAPVPALRPGLPVDAATVAAGRFLAQATFGPTAADIAFVKSQGMQAWLDRQFDPVLTPPSSLNNLQDINQLRKQQFLNMAHGQDQLRQRMMFALSQILVMSAEKNVNANEMAPWLGLLSQHAFGNYRDLLHDLTLDAGMGKYLDLANSRKPNGNGGANENYARELMQLFTIGLVELDAYGDPVLDSQNLPKPTYNQNDIRQFALALTGWTFPTPPGRAPGQSNWAFAPGVMEALPMYHDLSAKALLNGTVLPAGNSIEADLNGVLDNLFNHPNLPPFIATRLIRSLVTSNPSGEYIRRVADVFAGVNPAPGAALAPRGDLKATLTAILLDPEAREDAPQAEQGRLKDPVLHLTGLARALDAQFTDPGMFMYIMTYLGERVLNAPTVFSFYSPLTPLPGHTGMFGPEFQIYSPSQALQRANLIYSLLSDANASALSVNLTPFTSVAIDPNELLDRIDARLFMGRMSPELRGALYTLAAAHDDLKQRALIVLYLAAISSEYTVER